MLRAPPSGTPMKIDDATTRPGFVTALSDAYLIPRNGAYAIFWRVSGGDLCTVEREVAERALRGERTVVRLGSWSGTLRGRADEWTLWWARGVPWASTSDVADGDHTLRLIERWRDAAARAEARGQRWEPVPPGAAPPPRRPAPPAPARRERPPLLARLRALFRTH
ncbi:MAG TPA: hypothetical protein VH834_20765 [Solirubrobacteraceae bacterium]